MILPENGSVVIIDDREEEALPVIKAFSKNGIPVTYYRGIKEGELPTKPVQLIRLAIVDLQLVQGETNEHTIATRLVNILKRIIAEDNGPYILLIWSTKDALFAETLRNEIRKIEHNIVPSMIRTLNKLSCLERDNSAEKNKKEIIDGIKGDLIDRVDDAQMAAISDILEDRVVVENEAKYLAKPDAIKTIESEVEAGLKQAGVFHLLIIWENLVKKSASQTVSSAANVISQDENWEKNMRDVFRRMGIARVGKNIVENKILLKESVLTFIQSFTDKLENEIKLEAFPDNIDLNVEDLLVIKLGADNYTLRKSSNSLAILIGSRQIIQAGNLDKLLKNIEKHTVPVEKTGSASLVEIYQRIPAFLNTSLHLELTPSAELIPGNIYEINVGSERASELLKHYFPVLPADINDIKFIELEVSPICDYAQGKWKKSRLLSGIILPHRYRKDLKSNEHHYEVNPDFFIGKSTVSIVFDCHLLKALDKEIVSKRKVKYRLKRELLLDVIAKLSAHVNRPGIAFIE